MDQRTLNYQQSLSFMRPRASSESHSETQQHSKALLSKDSFCSKYARDINESLSTQERSIESRGQSFNLPQSGKIPFVGGVDSPNFLSNKIVNGGNSLSNLNQCKEQQSLLNSSFQGSNRSGYDSSKYQFVSKYDEYKAQSQQQQQNEPLSKFINSSPSSSLLNNSFQANQVGGISGKPPLSNNFLNLNNSFQEAFHNRDQGIGDQKKPFSFANKENSPYLSSNNNKQFEIKPELNCIPLHLNGPILNEPISFKGIFSSSSPSSSTTSQNSRNIIFPQQNNESMDKQNKRSIFGTQCNSSLQNNRKMPIFEYSTKQTHYIQPFFQKEAPPPQLSQMQSKSAFTRKMSFDLSSRRQQDQDVSFPKNNSQSFTMHRDCFEDTAFQKNLMNQGFTSLGESNMKNLLMQDSQGFQSLIQKPPKPPGSGIKGVNGYEGSDQNRYQQKASNSKKNKIDIPANMLSGNSDYFPQYVIFLLAEEDKNISGFRERVEKEKAKIQSDLDHFQKQINNLLEDLKMELLQEVDAHFKLFMDNYKNFKSNIIEFKSVKSQLPVLQQQPPANNNNNTSNIQLIRDLEDLRYKNQVSKIYQYVGEMQKTVLNKVMQSSSNILSQITNSSSLYHSDQSQQQLTELKNAFAMSLSARFDPLSSFIKPLPTQMQIDQSNFKIPLSTQQSQQQFSAQFSTKQFQPTCPDVQNQNLNESMQMNQFLQNQIHMIALQQQQKQLSNRNFLSDEASSAKETNENKLFSIKKLNGQQQLQQLQQMQMLQQKQQSHSQFPFLNFTEQQPLNQMPSFPPSRQDYERNCFQQEVQSMPEYSQPYVLKTPSYSTQTQSGQLPFESKTSSQFQQYGQRSEQSDQNNILSNSDE